MARKRFEPNLNHSYDFVPEFGRRRASSVLFSLRGLSKKKTKAVSTGYQRVLVKARVVVMRHGKSTLKAHLRYLERSGTGPDGSKPIFFGESDAHLKIKEWADDPHHFRFILSPEKGGYLELEGYTKRVVSELEKDLGKKLEWFSVCHYNTDNPHSHITIRGVDREGNVLTIPKEVIKRGFRSICEREATRDLGLRINDWKFDERELDFNKFTWFDRTLLKEFEEGRVIKVGKGRERQYKRLCHLRSLGLAEERWTGNWILSSDLESKLRKLSQREDLVAALPREFQQRQIIVLGEDWTPTSPVLGRIEGVCLLNELSGEKAVILEATDGRVLLIRSKEEEKVTKGEICFIQPVKLGAADEVILNRQSEGVFSLNALREAAQKWKIPAGLTLDQYISRYQERLDNLEKIGAVRNLGSDRYEVHSDFQEKVTASLGGRKPVFEKQSVWEKSLEELSRSSGINILDTFDGSLNLYGLGAEIRVAKEARKNWLIERGLYPLTPETRRLLVKDQELEIAKLFPKLKLEKLRSGDQVRGRILKYVPTGLGVRAAIRSENKLYLLGLQKGGFSPDEGTEVTFQVKGQKEADGYSQVLDKIRVDRER